VVWFRFRLEFQQRFASYLWSYVVPIH